MHDACHFINGENMFNKTLISTTLAVVFTISSSIVLAKKGVEVTSTKVSDKIYMFSAKGGNIGVFIGQDGTFVIDDQFAPISDTLLEKIISLGGSAPKFLINTHFHGDHTGGNENFGKKGAIIVGHENVRQRLKQGSIVKAFDMKTPPAAKVALPVITYNDKMHFHINNDDISIIHVANAHTDGDSFVYFKRANVIHAGDIFFNGFYPFIDTDNGGSLKGTIKAVDNILAISNADSKIIPGHGPMGDKKQLETYRKMLKTAYTHFLALKDKNVSVKDAVTQKPLKLLDEKWGNGIFNSDRWVELVYPSVSK